MLALAFLLTLAYALAADKPHVLLLVIDDYGWANAGWHRAPGTPGADEVVTPNLNALVRSGVELNRSYIYQFCSPSRSALQSGRNPVHVNLYNQGIPLHNPQNIESGGMGMARNMTGLGKKMRAGGYATHQFGKWGIGCASPEHTPRGRGYDTSFGYFDHTLDYWTEKAYEQCPGFQTTDLWASDAPAYGVNGSFSCSQANQSCAFLDDLIVERLLATIAAHDPAQPLFLYWAPHATHSPLEVPRAYYDRFPFVSNASGPSNFRRLYDALTNYIDEAVGNVTRALRAKGMYDNLLVIMTTDNGGAIDPSSGPATGANGANNYPLRGGKVSNWEGGIRGNAFVSGGFVPPAARGTVREGLVGIEDWYPTLCGLAGVPVHDEAAAAAGLPPVDGVDQWPYISGANATPPRSEWLIGAPYPIPGPGGGMGNGTVQGILSPPWKYVIGNMTRSVWLGPVYPNASTDWDAGAMFDCGDPLQPSAARPGCLFDVFSDPEERRDVARDNPAVVQALRARVAEAARHVFDPDRGVEDSLACDTALHTWHGFWGPFTP